MASAQEMDVDQRLPDLPPTEQFLRQMSQIINHPEGCIICGEDGQECNSTSIVEKTALFNVLPCCKKPVHEQCIATHILGISKKRDKCPHCQLSLCQPHILTERQEWEAECEEWLEIFSLPYPGLNPRMWMWLMMSIYDDIEAITSQETSETYSTSDSRSFIRMVDRMINGENGFYATFGRDATFWPDQNIDDLRGWLRPFITNHIDKLLHRKGVMSKELRDFVYYVDDIVMERHQAGLGPVLSRMREVTESAFWSTTSPWPAVFHYSPPASRRSTLSRLLESGSSHQAGYFDLIASHLFPESETRLSSNSSIETITEGEMSDSTQPRLSRTRIQPREQNEVSGTTVDDPQGDPDTPPTPLGTISPHSSVSNHGVYPEQVINVHFQDNMRDRSRSPLRSAADGSLSWYRNRRQGSRSPDRARHSRTHGPRSTTNNFYHCNISGVAFNSGKRDTYDDHNQGEDRNERGRSHSRW